jgi:CelD/BcsL family acetyltransferase involved in cellulose biosynthesis
MATKPREADRAMTMAAVIEGQIAGTRTHQRTSRIARIEILHDMHEAEPIWRRLEYPLQLTTPYQRFDFQAAWQKHVGEPQGLKPFLVVAWDVDHQPLLLLPLAVARQNGMKIARFLGGKHVTFNMALWRRDFAALVSQADLDGVMGAIRGHSENIDVLALTRQPQRWGDMPNPMARLPHQASVNDCPLMTIVPGAPPGERISNSFRRRLKGKERKLQSLPGYRYIMAVEDADIKRLLDAFFTVKPLRMAEQKLPNVFADPGVEDFIRAGCMARLPDGGHAIDIHALECDDEVIAIFAGVADGHRFSMMFNTYTMSGNARFSPGLILMRNIVDSYAGHGYTSLDLGIGSDDYKRLFCKGLEPIFDSFLPVSSGGKVAAKLMSSLARAKRLVKQTPALMQMAQTLRSVLHR